MKVRGSAVRFGSGEHVCITRVVDLLRWKEALLVPMRESVSIAVSERRGPRATGVVQDAYSPLGRCLETAARYV